MRPWVGQLGFFEEVLDLDGSYTVESRHTRSTSLNCCILAAAWMYLKCTRHLREVDDGAQVVVQPFEGIEVLEQLDQALGAEGVAVLEAICTTLLRLARMFRGEHLSQDLEGALLADRAEVGQKELRCHAHPPCITRLMSAMSVKFSKHAA